MIHLRDVLAYRGVGGAHALVSVSIGCYSTFAPLAPQNHPLYSMLLDRRRARGIRRSRRHSPTRQVGRA